MSLGLNACFSKCAERNSFCSLTSHLDLQSHLSDTDSGPGSLILNSDYLYNILNTSLRLLIFKNKLAYFVSMVRREKEGSHSLHVDVVLEVTCVFQ